MTATEKLESAERRITELENIAEIQAKQIERLLDARDIEIVKRRNLEQALASVLYRYREWYPAPNQNSTDLESSIVLAEATIAENSAKTRGRQ